MPNPAEAACIAGPNPVCIGGLVGDIATSAAAIIATGAATAEIIDLEKKRKEKEEEREKEKPKNCPLDDGDSCIEEQARLLAIREMIRGNYNNTDAVTYRTAILMFNSEARVHNMKCPSYPVPEISDPGPMDYFPPPGNSTLPEPGN